MVEWLAALARGLERNVEPLALQVLADEIGQAARAQRGQNALFLVVSRPGLDDALHLPASPFPMQAQILGDDVLHAGDVLGRGEDGVDCSDRIEPFEAHLGE